MMLVVGGVGPEQVDVFVIVFLEQLVVPHVELLVHLQELLLHFSNLVLD